MISDKAMIATPTNPSAVLFVGAGVPWLGGAGYLVRQFMLLKALAQLGCDLHLALIDGETDAPPPPFRAHVSYVPHAMTVKETRWRSLINDVVVREPMSIRTMDAGPTRAAVKRLHPERFDAVVAYRCDFAYAAGVLNHGRLILDIDDPEHLRRSNAAEWFDDGNTAWQRAMDLRRLKRFELACARGAHACFVCQPNDAIPFRESGVNPIIVPNCVEVNEHTPQRAAISPRIVFVGNLEGSEASPNVDGMRWFVREVWSAIRENFPHAELLIVGPIRQKWRDEVAPVPGVRVMGFVSDLPDLLRSARASIAPIRFGTGTRIKILEAMAGGCPVVSTTKGCEGLDVENGRDLLIGDSPTEFATACVRLLDDADFGNRLGHAGWLTVSDRYNRSRRERWLAGILAELIGIQQVSDLRNADANAA